MRIARFWIRESLDLKDSKGEIHRGEAWGWSETSEDEARRRGKSAAERVAQWLLDMGRGPEPRRSWEYYSLDRPPREEIVQELKNAAGDTTAFISRNSYGALVLNTRDLMFVDVDFPSQQAAAVGLLKRLFGKPTPPPPDGEQAAVDRVRAWCTANSSLGLRLYRTAAGLRVALIGHPVEPNGDEARQILEELQSDPLYRRLCEAQECFRARLTPKPWRMTAVKRLYAPLQHYPFADAATEASYRAWQHKYDKTAPSFATCRLLETYGPVEMHPELASLVNLHDSLTGSEQPLPLA
jgi:hypothetical protein